MSFLIAGLGNIGVEYAHTRHNIGFEIADALAFRHQANFTSDRYADMASFKLKGRQVTVIKPTTFMNLSGKAIRYWMHECHCNVEQLLVLVDDLALPFGSLRMRGNGSDAGHNGLKHIQEMLQTQQYPRLRFGIGNNFPKGHQIDFVLGQWDSEEAEHLPGLIDRCTDACDSFVLQGLSRTMNVFNTGK